MSIRSIALLLLLNGLLIPGAQAADLSPPPSSVTGKLLGLGFLGHGFLAHLRSMKATMSQKPSVTQSA